MTSAAGKRGKGKEPSDTGLEGEEEDMAGLSFEQRMQWLKAQAEERRAQAEERRAQAEERERERDREVERARELARIRREELELQLELARRAAPAPAQDRFDVHKASALLPLYDERDVEMYLSNFEKTATISKWPADKLALILQPKLTGKALKAYERLSITDLTNYDRVKKAILDELELVAEVYRAKFRSSTKRNGETYCDYAAFMTTQFDRWLSCEKVDSFEKLKQLILKEQFLEKLPVDMKVYLAEKDESKLNELARTADEYAVLHRSMGKAGGHVVKPGSTSGHGGQASYTSGSSGAKQGQGSGVSSTGVSGSSGYGSGGPETAAASTGSAGLGNYGRPRYSGSTNGITCFYCKGPHYKRDCPKLRQDQAATVNFVKTYFDRRSATDVNDYVVPVTVKNDSGEDVVLSCWRDTGAKVSLLREGSVPLSCLKPTGEIVHVMGVNSVDAAEVPEYEMTVESPILSGRILVAVTPRTFCMPNAKYPFLLGNDFGPKLTFGPVTVNAVMTRSKARLQVQVKDSDKSRDDSAEVNGTTDSHPVVQPDLVETNDNATVLESIKALFEPDLDKEMTVTDTSTDSTLAMKQRQDPTLTEVFDKVAELGQYDNYKMHANGLLVHVVHKPEAGTPSGASNLPCIVVPRDLRTQVLTLAHSIPASGHLGVGKTRKRIVPFFYWPGMQKDIKQYCKTCDVCQRNGKTQASGPRPNETATNY
jgi:hypothetical protein